MSYGRQRGSVLIVVLFVMSALSLLALGLAYRGALEIRASRDNARLILLQSLTKSAVAAELSELALRTDDFDHPAQSWASHPPFYTQDWFRQLAADGDQQNDYVVVSSVRDEESKLNLKNISSETFTHLGLSQEQMLNVMEWMGVADAGGSNSIYYSQKSHPYRVKGSPIELMNELLMVKGLDLPILAGDEASPPSMQLGQSRMEHREGLLSVLTAVSQKINLNTAPPAVLDCLPISRDAVGQIVAYRTFDRISSGKLEDHAFRSAKDIEQLQGLSDADRVVLKGVATFKSRFFTIQVRSTHQFSGISYGVRVLVVDGDNGPQILQWDGMQ